MNNTNRVVRVPFNLHRNNPSHEQVYKILEKAENKNAYIREAIIFIIDTRMICFGVKRKW